LFKKQFQIFKNEIRKRYHFKELAKKIQQRKINKKLKITGSFSKPTKTLAESKLKNI
jgi:tRNA A-37 threonylcarbamoyl transferase component Bud32